MKTYPSKLLLFGEYTVLSGSSALAVPLARYAASWRWSERPVDKENGLRKLLHFIKHQSQLNQIILTGDFENDLERGLYLHSTIPSGYGLGSSGAVCAAVLDRYTDGLSIKNYSLGGIHLLLKQMEECFHGSSSGIDPLVSFFQSSFLLKKERVDHHKFQFKSEGTIHVYIVDSKHNRVAAPIISHYKTQIQNGEFRKQVEGELVPAVEFCIQHILKAEKDVWWKNLQLLSEQQLLLMKPMIHESVLDLWHTCLLHGDTAMKLCGAGGGGFYLLFTKKRQIDFIKGDKRIHYIGSI